MSLPGVPRFLGDTEPARVLDLAPGLGQRTATFRYELVDGLTGVRIGDVTPLRTTIPVLVHSTQNTIMRTLTGLNFGAADTAEMNPITDRIRPYMSVSLPDGSVEEFPLGRYMYNSFNRAVNTGGDQSQNNLFDEMFIVDQQIISSFNVGNFGYRQGVAPEEAIEKLLRPLVQAGLIRYSLVDSGQGVYGSWPPGTTRAKILSDICTQGGYFQPWFDNAGIMQIIPAFNPAEKLPDFDFDLNDVVFQDTISYTNDFLEAPNRYVAINTSGTTSDGTSTTASGYYDVPSSAPWSFANRGFLIPDVTDIQAPSFASLKRVAQTIAEQDTIFERVQLSSAPNPLHDSYNVIRWQESQWLEISWSIQMQEGAPMLHTMRKAYQ